MSMLKRSYSDFNEAKLNGVAIVDEASRKRQNTGITNGHGPRTVQDSDIGAPTAGQPNNVEHAAAKQAQLSSVGALENQDAAQVKVSEVTEELESLATPTIFHVTQGLVSLRTLVDRLSQDTFNGLNDIISEVAAIQTSKSASGDDLSEQKKARLWQFLQDRRAKYIKMIVIAQWSRKAPMVSKCIDTYSWQVSQRRVLQEAVNWLGEMKRLLAGLRTNRSYLPKALSILATGRDKEIGELGFISKRVLSAKETLRAVHDLNSLIVIRLNSEKDFDNSQLRYKVANGRVTFSFANEFDLDLTIGSKDLHGPFYFLDLRLKFEPCEGSLSSERILFEMRWRLNQLLATGGLNQCFKELRNVVLTHRVSILRQQGLQLIQEGWRNDIRVEWAHRELVIQYWTSRSGPKSWFEIGVAKSGLKIRWFLQGRRMKDPELDMNSTDSSLRKILETITAAHSNHIFSCAKSVLRSTGPYAAKSLTIKHRRSRHSYHASLVVELLRGTTLTLTISASSGRVSVLPLTWFTTRLQTELNRLTDLSGSMSKVLIDYRGRFVVDQTSEIARSAEWVPMTDVRLNSETKTRLFGSTVSHFVLYKMSRTSAEWLVALTIDGGLMKWWVVRNKSFTEHEQTATQIMLGQISTFRFSIPLHPLPGSDLADEVCKIQDFERLSTAAVLLITRSLDLQELQDHSVSHQTIAARNSRAHQKDSPEMSGAHGLSKTAPESTRPNPASDGLGASNGSMAYRPFPALRISLLNLLEPGVWDGTVWAHSTVLGLLSSYNVETSTVTAQYFGRLAGKGAVLEVVRAQLHEQFSVDRKTGNFRININVSFGSATVQTLKNSLLKLQDLINLLTSLRSAGLNYRSATLDRINVVYAEHGDLKPEAVILLGRDRTFQVKVGPNDPYRALQSMLDKQLSLASCESLLKLMQTNFILAHSLQTICSTSLGLLPQPIVFATNLSTYKVKYRQPDISYEIRAEFVKTEIVNILQPVLEPRNADTASFWSDYLRARTTWTGLQTTVMVPLHAVNELVKNVQNKWQILATARMHDAKNGLASSTERKPETEKIDVVMID